MRPLSWLLRLLLSSLFLAAGTLTLAGHPEAVATFDNPGLGQHLRVLVGALEVAGGLGLLFTPLAALAALGLAALMVVAFVFHLEVIGGNPLPAAVALGLALAVVWLERSGLGVLAMLRTGKGPMDGWIARAYDRGVQAALCETFPDMAGDLLRELAGVRRVLDAGCGPGQFTVLIAEGLPAAEVWGVDLAPTMIDLAREHARRSAAGARLRFEVGDVVSLPFDDAAFDAVVSSGSIKHWPDPVAGLRELHRVLQPGGRAFVAEMNRLAPPAAAVAMAARMRSSLFRWLYPRVLAKGLSPAEARGLLGASPFGPPVGERMLFDGCIWVLEARKA